MKEYLRSSFFFALIVSFGPILFPLIEGSKGEYGVDWTKILLTYGIAVIVNTFIIAFLRKKGREMMKSFTDPEDGPIT